MNDSRLAIVTGATGAIGGAIARGLAEGSRFEVLLLVRNERKGERMVENVKLATRNPQVSCAVVDVALKSSISRFVREFDRPVNLLVNNAAVAPPSRQITSEGVELQFATNVLGYLWLTFGLKENLAKAAPSRVVNVASYWAGDLEIDDLEFKRRRYDNNTAYRQSKQANRMLTVALAERLRPLSVTVNACHPGDVNSTLSNSLGFGGSESPESGARTPVWLGTSADVADVTGKYFADCREQACRFASDRAKIERLYEVCERFDLGSSI